MYTHFKENTLKSIHFSLRLKSKNVKHKYILDRLLN